MFVSIANIEDPDLGLQCLPRNFVQNFHTVTTSFILCCQVQVRCLRHYLYSFTQNGDYVMVFAVPNAKVGCLNRVSPRISSIMYKVTFGVVYIIIIYYYIFAPYIQIHVYWTKGGLGAASSRKSALDNLLP